MEPFISTDDLEAIMDTDLTPGDLAVAIALDSACQAVRTYLGQTVNLVVGDTEVHSGSGRKKLRLRQRPVRGGVSIVEDKATVVSTNYSIRGAVITRIDGMVWSPDNDNIVVTYSHGWNTDVSPAAPDGLFIAVPSDIRMVALLTARRIFDSVGAGAAAGAIISETIGDYSYELSQEAAAAISSVGQLNDAEKFTLDPYRVELVGDTPTQ